MTNEAFDQNVNRKKRRGQSSNCYDGPVVEYSSVLVPSACHIPNHGCSINSLTTLCPMSHILFSSLSSSLSLAAAGTGTGTGVFELFKRRSEEPQTSFEMDNNQMHSISMPQSSETVHHRKERNDRSMRMVKLQQLLLFHQKKEDYNKAIFSVETWILPY